MDTTPRIDVEPGGLLYYAGEETDRPVYKVLLSETPSFAGSAIIDVLREGILGIHPTPHELYARALVPHGNVEQGDGGFYPLPLIFATEQEREDSAEAYGKRPPPESWVRRKRTIFLHALGLSQLADLHHRDEAFQAARRDAAARHLAVHGTAELAPDLIRHLPKDGRYYLDSNVSPTRAATLGHVRAGQPSKWDWVKL